MGFKCGIIGLPNVGKSTLFNALTDANVAAQNYPFCTIEPNIGLVAVPDPRLTTLSKIVEPEKVISTSIEFVDIAGLVKGAAQGEGLGNKFLSHIREVDAVAQVIRCFEDDNIIHVNGKVDPLYDLEIIETELVLADLETASKALNKASKTAKSGEKTKTELFELLYDHLNQLKPARTLQVKPADALLLQELHLISNKPIMYVANVDEATINGAINHQLQVLQAYCNKINAPLVILSATMEQDLLALTPKERQEFLSHTRFNLSGLDRMINAGYNLLKLQTFFTAGKKEVRAWTTEIGATAPVAAGKIHSDFEKGFIRAEVISFNDFVNYKGTQGAKDAGKWRLEGKEYIVQDGDIMLFRFNN